MKVQEVLEAAKRAKEAGSTRFCMGAAWRELGGKKNAFKHILNMVEGVNKEGLEGEKLRGRSPTRSEATS